MNPPAKDESAWVGFIRDLWGRSGAEVDLGDDACVLPPARYALSTDAYLEHVDFELDWAPARAVGHKALAASLSDLAAMGAVPRFLVLTLGWPAGFDEAYLRAALEGMRDLSALAGVGLCGGDLTESPGGLLIGATVLGEQRWPPLRRSGGCPGDLLFVTGPLGGPAEALRRFRSGERLDGFGAGPPADAARKGLDRFFRPPDQAAFGQFLARRGVASCCMDVSDGLARDLARLCEASGCGAEVEVDRIPLEEAARVRGEAAALEAVVGGEEQVLLFAVPPERQDRLSEAPSGAHAVGRLTDGGERVLVFSDGRREPLPQIGFDHFVA